MELPLSKEVLAEQLKLAKQIIEKWETAQIPGIDMPGTEEQAAETVRQLAGELLLVARSCEAVAGIVLGEG